MNISNFTGPTNIIDCGVIQAKFNNSFAFNFKFSIIMMIVLFCAYVWLINYFDKLLNGNKITIETYKILKNYALMLFYVFIMMGYFVLYTIFLSGFEF